MRGYALSAQLTFLAPYYSGVAEEQTAVGTLRQLASQLPPATMADLDSVTAQAQYWRTHYAQPTITLVQRTGKPTAGGNVIAGKAYFDALRAKVAVLQADVLSARTAPSPP